MNQRATPVPPAPERRDDAPDAKRAVPDPAPHRPGRTTPRVEGEPSPRLPHERDESSDSQSTPPQPIIEQARQDIERGLTDTDRGPPMDEAYRKQKQDGRPPARRERR
jgi:hypothetical protein